MVQFAPTPEMLDRTLHPEVPLNIEVLERPTMGEGNLRIRGNGTAYNEGQIAAGKMNPAGWGNLGLDTPEKIDAEVLKPFREAYGLSKEMKFKPTAPTSFEQHTSLYEKYLAQANAATDPSQKQHYQELSDMTKKLMEKDSSFAPRAPDKPDRPIKETIAAGEDQPQIVKSYTQAEWDARPIQNKNELDLLSKYAELKSKVAAGDMKLGPDWNPLASERTVQLAKVRTQLQQLGIDAETGKRTGSLVINPSSGTLTNTPTLGAPPPFAPAVVAANVTQKDYESLKPGDSYWWNGKKIPKK
jgi:hypothetical protein